MTIAIRPKSKLWARPTAALMFALAIGIVFLYPPGGVLAQAPAGKRAGAGKPGAERAAERGEDKTAEPRRGRGERQIEEFDIVGKIYKPEVFVFLGRKSLNLDWDLDDPRFKRSFLEAVTKAVWEPPF